MKKSEAYLLGYQQGLGGNLDLTKTAEVAAVFDASDAELEKLAGGGWKGLVRKVLALLGFGSKPGPSRYEKFVKGYQPVVHFKGKTGKAVRPLDMPPPIKPAATTPAAIPKAVRPREGVRHPLMGGGSTKLSAERAKRANYSMIARLLSQMGILKKLTPSKIATIGRPRPPKPPLGRPKPPGSAMPGI